MKKLFLSCSIVLMLTACATQTAHLDTQPSKLSQEDMQTFFVSGLGQTQTVNAAAVCGSADKVVKVERVKSFLDGVLGLLSFGIYTPEDAKVYCKI